MVHAMISDPARRTPLTLIPEVHRLSGGHLQETAGYRVLRTRGTTDWLIIHTVGGRGRFGRPDGGDISVTPGTVTLLAPGTPHDYGVEALLRHWEIYFSHFHPRPEWPLLLDWPEVAPGIGQLQLDGEVDERTRQVWRTLSYWARSEQPRSDLFGMNALELILLWCDTQNARAVPLDARILRVLEHLDRHLAEPITVPGLARVAHLSTSRFAHLFSAQLGMSPSAYLERQRIAQARLLLEHTQRPVGEIARSVGFADPLYFSTRFRHVVGVSPTRYRAERRPEHPIER
jgi:AraC family transcriptional regulator of arabinose operon